MGNEQSTQQSVSQEHDSGHPADEEFSSTDEDTYKAPSKPQTTRTATADVVIANSTATTQKQAQKGKRKRREREQSSPMAKVANSGAVVAETPKAQMRQSAVQHDQPSSKKRRRGAKGGSNRRTGSSVATSSPSISRTVSHDEDMSVNNLDMGKELPAIPSWPQEEAVPMTSASQALRDREPEAFGEYARSESEVDELLASEEKESRHISPVGSKATGEDKQDREFEKEDVKTGADNENESPHDESPSEVEHSSELDKGDLRHSVGSHAGQKSSQTSREPQKVANGRFPCPCALEYNCDTTFGTKASATRHADAVHLKRTIKCDLCNTTFARHDKLKSHQRHEHPASDVQLIATAVKARRGNVENGAKALEIDGGTSAPIDHLHNLNFDEEKSGPDLSSEDAANDETKRSEPALRKTNTTDGLTISQSSDVGSDEPKSNLGDGTPLRVEEVATEVVARLKRKRGLSTTNYSGLQTPKTYGRRRRTTDMNLSPSTSPEVEEPRLGLKVVQANGKTSSAIQRPPTKKIRTSSGSQSGPLDRYVEPSSQDSQVRHPQSSRHLTKKPGTDQQVQVILSQSGHATSSNVERINTNATPIDRPESHDRNPSLAEQLEKRDYTTRNGKGRANPGVEYSSPQKDNASESESSDADSEPHQIATSVATRTDRSSSSFQRRDGGKSRSARVSRANTNTSEGSVYEDAPESTLLKASEAKPVHLEKRSNAQDDNESRDHVRKGPFSSWENNKLNQWRDDFCAEYEIREYEFNDMMTQSCRRGKQHIWGWQFITKEDFLKNYYDILPDRDRRSMHRYRERHFQNVVPHQDWTPEDDKELEELVAQWGTKWVEIGQRMGRTQDAVNQRYRNKVRDGGNLKRGEWDDDEVQKLRDAVAEVKSKVDLSLDEESDTQISWEAVKNLLGGIRTAQQCSNKWRLLFHLRKGGKFIKAPSTIRDRISRPEHRTPSKMDLRLNAQTPSSSAKKKPRILSEAIVQNSDDEDETSSHSISDAKRSKRENLELDEVTQVPESSQPQRSTERNSSETTEDSEDEDATVPDSTMAMPTTESTASQLGHMAETPLVSRNPFTSKTPTNQMSTSQAFNETQANTSARRTTSNQTPQHMFSEARPSPNITMQYRPISSPLALIGSTQPARAGDVSSQPVNGNNSDNSSDEDDTFESRPEQPENAGEDEQHSDSSTSTSGDSLSDGSSIKRRKSLQSSPRLTSQTRARRTYELSLNGSDTGRQKTPQQNRWNSVNGWQRSIKTSTGNK